MNGICWKSAEKALIDQWRPEQYLSELCQIELTRSIQDGIKNGTIQVEPISDDAMRVSQEGSYNHRHEGLYVRIKEAKNKSISIPQKRYGNSFVSLDIFLLQKLRRKVRKESLKVWQATDSAVEFDTKMKKTLSHLKLATQITRYKRGAFKLVKKVFSR